MGITAIAMMVVLGALIVSEAASSEYRYISNFRDQKDVDAFEVTGARADWAKDTEDGALIEGVALETEAVQAGSMHLVLEPGKGFAELTYTAEAGMPSDWSGYEMLALHFENGSEFMINMHMWVRDTGGEEYFTDELWISRSRNRMAIPLDEMRTKGGERIDVSKVKSLRLEIRSAEKFERDIWLFRFRLEKAEAACFDAPAQGGLYDFGPLGAEVVPGAKMVTEKTSYAKWRGYGWTALSGEVESTNCKKLDRLTTDWIWAGLADGEARFRVDLADGRYKGRFYGGNYNMKIVPVRDFELLVDGVKVAGKSVDAATYYTEAGHFLGMSEWCEPGEDPYDKYIAKFYTEYDFEFDVKGGKAEFEWKETLAAFGLLVTPAGGGAFEKATAQIGQMRRLDFGAHYEHPEKKGEMAATAAEKQRGFAVWSRPYLSWVGVYDVPGAGEQGVKELVLTAARGEKETAAVVVTPLTDVGDLTVEVGELTGAGGKIGAESVEVGVVKYMWEGWPAKVSPGYILPGGSAPGTAGVNRTFLVTVTPPAGAKGRYTGKVVVKSAGGGSAEVILSVDVRGFELTQDHPASFAWWRCSPHNMNYCMQYFFPEKMDYFRRILDAEGASMKAHGCNAWYFTAPILKGVEGEKVKIDFTLLDEEVAVCKRYDFCNEKHAGMVFTLPDVARYLMKETRYGDYMEPEDASRLPEEDKVEEFSELFNARYIDAVRQIDEYFKGHGLNVLIYPSDEPRERNTNRWNRNLEDTLRYCDMIHENVPGARVYVDPMRDGNSGVDYSPLLDHVEVLGTHPWDQSDGVIEPCRERGAPDLWYFNAIVWDRYDFGYEVAAAGATGFWQWHFQWDLVPFVPFHTGFKWGVTVPGPDGPLAKPNYELVAQSIDDYRYVATLEERVAEAKASGKAGAAVASAEKTLDEFHESAWPYAMREHYSERPRKARDSFGGRTLDEWRAVFAAGIEAIDAAK